MKPPVIDGKASFLKQFEAYLKTNGWPLKEAAVSLTFHLCGEYMDILQTLLKVEIEHYDELLALNSKLPREFLENRQKCEQSKISNVIVVMVKARQLYIMFG